MTRMFLTGFWIALVSALTFIGGIVASFLGAPVPAEWALLYFVGMPFGLLLILVDTVLDPR